MADILNLIKHSTVIRQYKMKKIPTKVIGEIVQAGVWTLSVHGFQPWHIVVIENKKIISKISKMSMEKADALLAGYNLILKSTAKTLQKSNVLIAIYNNGSIVNYSKRCKDPYTHYARIAELQCIGAVIENMFLEASSLGVGMAWLCAPLFCEKEINNILKERNELMALLSLGYPRRSVFNRSKRKCSIRVIK